MSPELVCPLNSVEQDQLLNKRRFLWALVFSPLVPPSLIFLISVFLLCYAPPEQWPSRTAEMVREAPGVAFDCYFVSLAIGAPIAFVLHKLQRLTAPSILICASASGLLCGMALELLVDWPRVDVGSGIVGGITGLLVSGSFIVISGAKFDGLTIRWRHAGTLIVVVDAAWIGWLGWQTVELRRFEENLFRTTNGMSQDEVVGLLGEPNATAFPCSYQIKPPYGCSTTVAYEGPFGSGALFYLDSEGHIIGAIKPRRAWGLRLGF